MSSEHFEAFVARLYADTSYCELFLSNPQQVARQAGLSETEIAALDQIDLVGLDIACQSFARKRDQKARHQPKLSRWRKLLQKVIAWFG
ncbi:MAG: hypothetical protein HY774_07280 [Acidobacteria bacterium]|nr:hypothetical protein [Acidobacteriota bacterium]